MKISLEIPPAPRGFGQLYTFAEDPKLIPYLPTAHRTFLIVFFKYSFTEKEAGKTDVVQAVVLNQCIS